MKHHPEFMPMLMPPKNGVILMVVTMARSITDNNLKEVSNALQSTKTRTRNILEKQQ